jgi:DNA-binding response OmpR family regulator
MKRIVITDEDPGMRQIYTIILQNEGYEVMTVYDTQSILSNAFELPDLFLLDNQRGLIDGLHICRYLKSRDASKNIPVIVVSAAPGIVQLALKAGANGSIEKPFHKKHLLQTIADCLQQTK